MYEKLRREIHEAYELSKLTNKSIGEAQIQAQKFLQKEMRDENAIDNDVITEIDECIALLELCDLTVHHVTTVLRTLNNVSTIKNERKIIATRKNLSRKLKTASRLY